MSQTIPMTDLQRQYFLCEDEIDAAIKSVLGSGRYILADNVRALEREIAERLGARHAVAVASGTDAIHLALRACDIGAGDEVITTPFTFVGTAEAIAYTGAKPVFVDIDPDTFNIDPSLIEAAITERTRAILPVHLYGQPVDLDPIIALCRRHGLRLIEDCAQSFGAAYQDRNTGTIGDVGCFSFYPSKNLGAYGDGGMVTTNDDALADAVRALGNHGSHLPQQHSVIGYNSRLDELQAAVLRVKLRRIDELNQRRGEWARAYNERLTGIAVPPVPRPGRLHVYNVYTIRCRERDALARHLATNGIASAVHYRLPLHRQPVFAESHGHLSFPVAEQVAAEVLCLPMYPELSAREVDRICDVISAFAESLDRVAAV